MENRGCQLNVPKVTRTLLLAFLASLAVPLAINRTQTRIIQTLCPRSLPLVVLFSVSAASKHLSRNKRHERERQTIVSGYSTWTTLIRLISSGEKRPNWISLIVRSGAFEYGKKTFDMMDGLSRKSSRYPAGVNRQLMGP